MDDRPRPGRPNPCGDSLGVEHVGVQRDRLVSETPNEMAPDEAAGAGHENAAGH